MRSEAMKKKKKTSREEKLYIIDKKASFGISEAFKSLRANLQFVCPHSGCKLICVTSSIAHEGKTNTAINTSIVIDEAEQKVLLIDGDLRAGYISSALSLRKERGLAELLASPSISWEGISDSIQQFSDHPGLDILVSGKKPPNPSELLNSERMSKLLSICKEKYDYIIIDGAPIGIVSDVLVLSREIDGYLVVVRQDITMKFMLRDTIETVERAGGKVLGFVLNDVNTRGASYGKYGKYGKYGRYYKYGKYYEYGNYDKGGGKWYDGK